MCSEYSSGLSYWCLILWSHKPFLCFPLETGRKEQKFQTSSSVVAQLGFFCIFLIWDWGLIFLFFKSSTGKLFIKSIISSSNGTGVFPLLQYGHSFCACVLKKSLNLWVSAGCKDPCWLLWGFLLDMSKKLNSDGANHLAENQFFTQVCPYYRTLLEASTTTTLSLHLSWCLSIFDLWILEGISVAIMPFPFFYTGC